jgi:hypothetical protein
MSVLLLVLGAVTAAAGMALVVSGVSIQEHVFDTAVLTPGVLGIVGGFLLIGFGLAVRVLQQIEATLAARPMPRTARPAEVAMREPGSGTLDLPHPPLIELEPAPADSADFSSLHEKFPAPVRTADSAPLVEETDASLLPKAPARIDEDILVRNGAAALQTVQRRGNGSASGKATSVAVARSASRPEAVPSAVRPERSKAAMFDTFWPKAPAAGTAEPAPAAIPAPVAQPEPKLEPPAVDYAAPADPAARPALSILKSGVVDGMAYTLYSDGSIEAQLPQGTLRFGSITELRNHIEQSS